MLTKFARWFASAGGVWQTLGFVAGWVLLEDLHVLHDPNGFELLYWLTVYSAITQPVLAYTNAQDTRQGERILALLGDALTRIEGMEQRELDALAAIGQQPDGLSSQISALTDLVSSLHSRLDAQARQSTVTVTLPPQREGGRAP